jgi:hypothetical protein
LKIRCVVLAVLATATHAQTSVTNGAILAAIPSAKAAPGKQLVMAVTVPAPLPAVWQAFTTNEGLRAYP